MFRRKPLAGFLSGLVYCTLTTLPCFAQANAPPMPAPVPEEAACVPAPAPEAPPAPMFGGPLFERLKLTGDWGGFRDDLAGSGILFDGSLTQFYQGVPRGGRGERAWQYGGKGDYFLNIDGEKAGLWKGFFITAHGETRYGEDVNNIDGLISGANVNMLFPRPNQDITALTSLKFTQALSENFITYFGKINFFDDYTPALGGGGRGIDRFMNTSLAFPLILGRTVPYSTYGAGFAVLSERQPVFTFGVLDAVDRATTGVDDIFDQGAVFAAQGILPVNLMGLPGHQSIGATYSTRKYTAVDRGSFFVIPGEGITAGKKTGSWCAYYSFDQYLYVDPCNPKQGWGVFGNAGIADGNPNPVRWFANGGVQGNSMISGREQDTFGVGFYYLGLSDDFKGLFSGPLAQRRGLGQQDEYGVELYYNVAVTPWCHLTADVQIVEPSTRVLDTTIITGVRLKIDF